MGASLLAIAVNQLAMMVTDSPLSRAGLAPTGGAKLRPSSAHHVLDHALLLHQFSLTGIDA
ncbi:hypothetical protein EGM97_17960 [Pseudomonas sp. AF32]|nr:hypothetical protein [Pseudomonas sp. AF32]